MRTIISAEPDKARDKKLVENIKIKTIASLDYLLSRCEQTLQSDLTEQRHYLKKTLVNKKCNGLLYAVHDRLLKLMKSNQISKVKKLIKNIDLSHCIAKSLDVIPLNSDKFSKEENKIIYITAQESHDQQYARKYDCKKPTDENYHRSKAAILEALKHIKKLDSDCYNELHELITDIVICDSKIINGGTCFNTFGFLYVRQLNDNENWLKYFEHIVHEAGHHHLYTVLAKDNLIKAIGNNQYYYSPLRKEKRPLNGIFQAMFVLARTIRVFNRMKANASYLSWVSNIRTHYNNANNDASFEEKFKDTYLVLKRHAFLTKSGKALLKSCYLMANS